MASARVIAFLAVLLVLHPRIVLSEFLSPLLSPIFGDVCKMAECGKGKCKPSDNSTLSYLCECDYGWKQTRSSNDDDLKFLPCVIPNCTLDYSCEAAPSPSQHQEPKANKSFLDPCHWTDCGGGSCNKTSAFTYSCVCAEGYSNLLNVSAFPCMKECSIGANCANLGISFSNQSSPPAPALSEDTKNQAGSDLLRNYDLLIILAMSLAMIL